MLLTKNSKRKSYSSPRNVPTKAFSFGRFRDIRKMCIKILTSSLVVSSSTKSVIKMLQNNSSEFQPLNSARSIDAMLQRAKVESHERAIPNFEQGNLDFHFVASELTVPRFFRFPHPTDAYSVYGRLWLWTRRQYFSNNE